MNENNIWNKLTIVSLLVISIVVILIFFNNLKSSDQIQKDALTCDGSPSGEVNSWQPFVPANKRYILSFPQSQYTSPASETFITIPFKFENLYGAEDSSTLALYIKESYLTYSVSHTTWSEEPTLSQLATFYGATKFCSNSTDSYEGNPMIDFLQISKSNNETFYARHRIITHGVDSYELKMNSDSLRFKDYDQFVQSFHLF